jgi:hypothetical protein
VILSGQRSDSICSAVDNSVSKGRLVDFRDKSLFTTHLRLHVSHLILSSVADPFPVVTITDSRSAIPSANARTLGRQFVVH